MRSADILVSGASVAGPAVAHWLSRAGHRVTVVERSPAVRGTGQNIDVRGPAREVLRRMGLEEAARAAGTGEVGLRFVDADDAVVGEFPAGTDDNAGATAEIEVLRGELARLLVGACGPDVEYIYGDQVAEVVQDPDRIEVTFAGGARRRFDLLIVADGIRSGTRKLVFGDVPVRELGLYTAYGTIERVGDDDNWWTWFNATGGRTATLRPDNLGTTRATLSFLSGPRGYEAADIDAQRAALRAHFADAGWKTPRILEALDRSGELYVDYNTQIRTRRWSAGRVVLLGDAAWCATPVSGMGTTLALTGAYLLAGEIDTHADHPDAFAAYRARMQPLVAKAQRLPPGIPRLALPRSRAGIRLLHIAVGVASSRPARFVTDHLPKSAARSTEPLPHYAFGSR